MKILIELMLLVLIMMNSSCSSENLSYQEGDLKIEVVTGSHWLHDFELFLGIKIKNPPQFAIWIEDTDGNYINTIYSTYRVATGDWRANGDDMRLSALPYWNHKRGFDYEAAGRGKYTKLTEGITGATPKKNKEIMVDIFDFSSPVVVMMEINQSTDFNEYYPKSAKKGDENYSGGDGGSGQPALIYQGVLNLNDKEIELELIGHSSPDGSTDQIYSNLESITTAKKILGKVIVTKIQEGN
jgi:hypothetical protein